MVDVCVCMQNFNASYLWKAIYDCKKPFVCALMSWLFHSVSQTHVVTKLIDDKNINLPSQQSVLFLSLSLSPSPLISISSTWLFLAIYFYFFEFLRIVLKSL